MNSKIEVCVKGKYKAVNYIVCGSACAAVSYSFWRQAEENARPVRENSQFSVSGHLKVDKVHSSSPNPGK